MSCRISGSNDTHTVEMHVDRLGKNEPNGLRGVEFYKRFSENFVKFSAKFGSINVQIRNNFKNIIFIVVIYAFFQSFRISEFTKENVFFQVCTSCRILESIDTHTVVRHVLHDIKK